MDPKVLLMPVYTRGSEIKRLRGALSLACFFGAHLDVLHAQSKPSDLFEGDPFGLSKQAQARMRAIMDEDALHEQEELTEQFYELCTEYGVALADHPGPDGPSARWQEVEGARSELIALKGRVSDLVIIPLSKDGRATLTFEAAILHTGRPVLLVPRGMMEFHAESVLIGWSGSLEGSRAVQQALPFLRRAKSVRIVSAYEAADQKPDGEELRDYLGYHGVAAEFETTRNHSSNGEALLSLAHDAGCDLMVTGGYTHTRLRQRVLGGVTQYLLKHADMPVLMAH